MSGFRNRLLKSVLTGGLPSGYQLCKYIESSGTQYIDTGFYPKYDTKVVMDVEGIGTQTQFLFGSRNENSSTAQYQFNLFRSDSENMRSDYFGSNSSVSVSDVSQRMTIVKDSNITTFSNYKIENNVVYSGSCTYPLFLFALNNIGEPLLYASCKLYSCQIYDNGVLVRDYIPCLNPDGYFGLYDKVGKTFYGSANDNLFTGPTSYHPCEYIESDGTQYIDTGIIPTSNVITVEVKAQYTGVLTSTIKTYYGFMKSSSSSTPRFGLHNYKEKFMYGMNATKTTSVVTDNNTHTTIYVGTSTAQVLYIDGEQISSIDVSDISSNTLSIFLMARNVDKTASNFLECRLYYCKIYINNILVRDYIPCHNSFNVYGLYDKVGKTFYESANNEPFTGKFL